MCFITQDNWLESKSSTSLFSVRKNIETWKNENIKRMKSMFFSSETLGMLRLAGIYFLFFCISFSTPTNIGLRAVCHVAALKFESRQISERKAVYYWDIIVLWSENPIHYITWVMNLDSVNKNSTVRLTKCHLKLSKRKRKRSKG